MKNLLLIIALFFAVSFANAQKLTPKFLKGTWENEFHVVEFKGDTKKDFSITITCKDDGTPIEVTGWVFDSGNLYVKTYYSPSNWEAIGKMIMIDENSMVEDVHSDYPAILIYKRKLNN